MLIPAQRAESERTRKGKWMIAQFLIHILSHSPLLVDDRSTAALLGTKNAWSTFNEAIWLKSEFLCSISCRCSNKTSETSLTLWFIGASSDIRWETKDRRAIIHYKRNSVMWSPVIPLSNTQCYVRRSDVTLTFRCSHFSFSCFMLQKACLAVPSRSADSTSQRIEEEGKKNMWKVPATTKTAKIIKIWV